MSNPVPPSLWEQIVKCQSTYPKYLEKKSTVNSTKSIKKKRKVVGKTQSELDKAVRQRQRNKYEGLTDRKKNQSNRSAVRNYEISDRTEADGQEADDGNKTSGSPEALSALSPTIRERISNYRQASKYASLIQNSNKNKYGDVSLQSTDNSSNISDQINRRLKSEKLHSNKRLGRSVLDKLPSNASVTATVGKTNVVSNVPIFDGMIDLDRPDSSVASTSSMTNYSLNSVELSTSLQLDKNRQRISKQRLKTNLKDSFPCSKPNSKSSPRIYVTNHNEKNKISTQKKTIELNEITLKDNLRINYTPENNDKLSGISDGQFYKMSQKNITIKQFPAKINIIGFDSDTDDTAKENTIHQKSVSTPKRQPNQSK